MCLCVETNAVFICSAEAVEGTSECGPGVCGRVCVLLVVSKGEQCSVCITSGV